VTNDAWFGDTPGPHQHFAQARLRTIEEGLPMVRAANNGISAVVDPLGRVIRRLELGRDGVLDSNLPQPLAMTTYARFRDVPAILAMVLLAGAAVAAKRKRASRK
jgi:apolipoprotein N-acyltransferase